MRVRSSVLYAILAGLVFYTAHRATIELLEVLW